MAAAASGAAVFVVDVDEIDVGGHIEFAPAELAHAQHPEGGALAVGAQRCAVTGVLLGQCGGQGALETQLGQQGHGLRDGLERRLAFDVEHGQAFDRQVAGHAQSRCKRSPAGHQGVDQRVERGARQRRRPEQR